MDVVKLLDKLLLAIDIEVIEARLPQPKRPWGRLADVGQPTHYRRPHQMSAWYSWRLLTSPCPFRWAAIPLAAETAAVVVVI